jgi:hypothetical protein
MTLHGPGYGLDETEAALAEIGGLEDAIRAGNVPPALEEVVIVERDAGRVERLADSLTRELGSAPLKPGNVWAMNVLPGESEDRGAAGSVGERSEDKPHVFVAMPFDPAMDDVYHYGIQRVVHERGWLCERLDQTAFTGDVVERIKVRIRTAKVVIAGLTGANPNVYLEVGYAWGVGRPTVFLQSRPPSCASMSRGSVACRTAGFRTSSVTSPVKSMSCSARAQSEDSHENNRTAFFAGDNCPFVVRGVR